LQGFLRSLYILSAVKNDFDRLTECRDGTSSTVSRSWATQLLKYGSDSQQGEEVSLLQNIQTGSRAHQDPSMGNGDKVDQTQI
jgi:hypothetical protein